MRRKGRPVRKKYKCVFSSKKLIDLEQEKVQADNRQKGTTQQVQADCKNGAEQERTGRQPRKKRTTKQAQAANRENVKFGERMYSVLNHLEPT
jgi:hypothetical protein